jgi:hypothetical protein
MKGMQQSCKEDIAKFCKEVEMGHGRVVSCLNDHVGELSPACKALVPGLITQMNEPMKPHADCADDVKKLCGDVKPGSGRMGFCLGEHAAELSPACKKQVDAMKARWDKGPARGRGAKGSKGAAPSSEAAPPPAK